MREASPLFVGFALAACGIIPYDSGQWDLD
jgi:hypothetical protein